MKPRFLISLVYADSHLKICAEHCRAGAKQTLGPKRVSAFISQPLRTVTTIWYYEDHDLSDILAVNG